MEPISSTTAAESAPPPSDSAPDPQLQHAAETLASVMGGETTPEQGGTQPAPPPPPREEQQPARPSRTALREQANQGWHQRQQARDRELRERRALQQEYEARIAETNRLAAQALEALRAGRPQVQQEEEIPDPTIDPAGFVRWLQGQNAAAIQAALKPIAEAEQARQEAAQRQWEASQLTEAQNEALAARRDQLDDWKAAYVQDAPELAAGFDDRYLFVHNALSEAYKAAGVVQGDERRLADMDFGAKVAYAEAAGLNPVLFLDSWFASLAGQFGYDPAGWEEGGPAPAPPANGNGYHPPAESETERLAKVRQRAAGAASAAPRQPGRATTTRSELQDLLRAGVTDMRQLNAAALKDAGGRADQAAVLLAQAAGQMG